MEKFNQLTVLEEVKHNKRLMYRVQCDCGRIDIKRKDWVISGRTTSCKNCASKRTAAKYPPPVNRTGCCGLSGTHYLSIKSGASKRDIPFDLSAEFLWNLFESQKGKCALTGVDIILVNKIKNNNVNWDVISASLDRKDSSKGYTEDNVQWVHKTINRLKNNYPLEELLYWSKLLLDYHGNPEPSLSGDTLEGATTRNRVSRDSNVPKSPQPHFKIGYSDYSQFIEYKGKYPYVGEDIV